MKTVCCECETVTREDVENDGLVSYGYCDNCRDEKLEEIRKITREAPRD